MKFLVNMNVPRDLGRQLAASGHEVRHAGDVGLAQAPDTQMVEHAKANGEVILTHDLDYGHLLAFSGDRRPSVIIFRVRNTQPDNLFTLLTRTWPEIEGPLLAGAVVVIEDAALRIRPLPIVPEG